MRSLFLGIWCAIGITALGFVFDRLLVSLFERDYALLPRLEFFFVGWPLLALIVAFVLRKFKKFPILSVGFAVCAFVNSFIATAYIALIVGGALQDLEFPNAMEATGLFFLFIPLALCVISFFELRNS